jgi:hypothetical protein
MDWQKLDLAQASLIKKEVDLVIQRLNELAAASNVDPEANSAKYYLINAVQSRIVELDNFYLSNSDDERATLFEKERLRLRKAIQPYLSAPSGNRSVATEGNDKTVSTGSVQKSQASVSNSHNNVNNVAPPIVKTMRSSNNSIANKSIVSQSVSKKSQNGSHMIYAWEDRSEKQTRQDFLIDNFAFEASSTPGFYNRKYGNEEEPPSSDKYIDFQIILTHEEMTALAARKKAERADVKLLKNQAAQTSIQAAAPYIDPKRIMKEMLRSGTQPDKWMVAETMKK